MPTVKVYNQKGDTVSELKLSEKVFGLPENTDLVHQAVRVSLANQRQILGSTKTREEVSGGGRKPWRQKGTGRARHGSIRSPLWKGGGVTFGPTSERNFKLGISKKMARKALLTALSGKVKDGELLVLDKLDLETSKTKEMAKIMVNFSPFGRSPVGGPATCLLVLAEKNEKIKRAGRNLPGLKITNFDNLNILDILKHKYLLITEKGIEFLNKKYETAN